MADIKYITGFTEKWEGGLSRATTDTASKNPSPYTYKGQTGWHTNKDELIGLVTSVYRTSSGSYFLTGKTPIGGYFTILDSSVYYF